MAYLGNTPTTQGFIPAIDYFSGNGATVAFTLSRPVASVAQVQATIENVPQNPGTAFTVSGNTITFDGAPPSGTNNIYVYYTSPITQVIQPGQGTVGTAQLANNILVNPAYVSDQLNASTGYFDLPAGTTAQRPGSPVNGMSRYNTTINQFEVYQNGAWTQYASGIPYVAQYLLVGGGGAGGSQIGGGGGGGGVVPGSASLSVGTVYTVTVGAGGSGGAGSGGDGNPSLLGTISVLGGGGGGTGGGNGRNGSSGGGAGRGAGAIGNGTFGFGSNGGLGTDTGGNSSGGGGGATAVGANASTTFGGNGGAGLASSITGSSVTYGGGGGACGAAGGSPGNPGSGGAGGGGGGSNGSSAPVNGTANTGGGGGGGGNISNTNGASGGSGFVVIVVPVTNYTGITTGSPTITTSGGSVIMRFTTSGTYTA